MDVHPDGDCGAIRMGDLAATLTLSPSRTSQQVRRLECQGLVRRITSSDDRRVVYAAITRDGRRRVQPVLATYAKAVREHYLDPVGLSTLGPTGRVSLPYVPGSCRGALNAIVGAPAALVGAVLNGFPTPVLQAFSRRVGSSIS